MGIIITVIMLIAVILTYLLFLFIRGRLMDLKLFNNYMKTLDMI